MPFTVRVRHDEAARVWYVHEADLPGLHAEAATLDELVAIIEDVAPDLVPDAANAPVEIPICIQHVTTARRARVA